MDEKYFCKLATFNSDMEYLVKQFDKSFLETKTYGELFDYMFSVQGDAINRPYNRLEECIAESIGSYPFKTYGVIYKDGSCHTVSRDNKISENLAEVISKTQVQSSRQQLTANVVTIFLNRIHYDLG